MGASPVVDVAKPVRARRERGMIERRGGSFRVKVYAGLGLQTGRRLYLTESTSDEREAERIRTGSMSRSTPSVRPRSPVAVRDRPRKTD